MKKLIIALLLISQVSMACNKSVTYLQEGSAAPCTGYLFSPEKEKEVREIKVKYADMSQLVAKQDELTQTLNQRIYVISAQNNNLREEIKNVESRGTLEKVIYFSLGIVLGLGIGKVLTK